MTTISIRRGMLRDRDVEECRSRTTEDVDEECRSRTTEEDDGGFLWLHHHHLYAVLTPRAAPIYRYCCAAANMKMLHDPHQCGTKSGTPSQRRTKSRRHRTSMEAAAASVTV